jgi:N-acetylneuraminic acid mutarotase
MPEAPIRNRWWHEAVWTGKEMIVFGGGRDSHARRDGAAYNPSTRSWRVLPKSPVGGYGHSLIWTGEEMITWGGIKDSTSGPHGFPTGFIAQGAAYDPNSDRWRILPPSGLNPRAWHSAVWTGEEMIVWGGVSKPQDTCYDCGYAADAGAYDPGSNSWRALDVGPLAGRVEHTAVWTGDHMIIYGGSTPGGGLARADGASYDVAHESWSMLPDAPIPGLYRHVGVWMDDAMAVWSGQRSDGGASVTGAMFVPNS